VEELVETIPPDHPRAESLKIRHRLTEGYKKGLVVEAGLIAHGRGEAFDYLIGEQTQPYALKAIKAAVAHLLLAKYPVISVNGNTAALAAESLVELAKEVKAKLEVNLFYRSKRREELIAEALMKAGATQVLGVGEAASAKIPELQSERRKVDPEGIFKADVVLVPLEDGDRTEALRRLGKTVIAIDLNPLSRTAQTASVTIVDNVVRALPRMVEEARALRKVPIDELRQNIENYDNKQVLSEAIAHILERLAELAEKGVLLSL